MEGDLLKVEYKAILCISIHSLRMEGDIPPYADIYQRLNFNPLPPHGGRPTRISSPANFWHFNPLPPHGGRPFSYFFAHSSETISIHSLRMEGDENRTLPSGAATIFQSTPSAWRETPVPRIFPGGKKNFNPLPPHGGRLHRAFMILLTKYFNPLPPHGGRPVLGKFALSNRHFNPLPPHGGRRDAGR